MAVPWVEEPDPIDQQGAVAATLPPAPARDVGAAAGATPLSPETLRTLGEINARPPAPAPQAPSRVPWTELPDQPPPAAAAPLPASSSADQSFWQRALDPSGGFTGAVVRGMPVVGQLPGLMAGATKATTDYLLGGGLSGTSPSSWHDLYKQNVAQIRAPEQQWAAAHPYQAGAADVTGGAIGSLGLGAVGRGVGLIPQGGRLITQIAGGMGLGGAGGAAQAALDPNATLPSVLAGAGTGAMAGGATAGPGVIPAAKAAGLTLKELGDLGQKIGAPLAGGAVMGHPLIGAALAAPGAATAGWDLIKMLGQKPPTPAQLSLFPAAFGGIPRFISSLAPGLGAEAGRVGSTLQQQQPAGYGY